MSERRHRYAAWRVRVTASVVSTVIVMCFFPCNGFTVNSLGPVAEEGLSFPRDPPGASPAPHRGHPPKIDNTVHSTASRCITSTRYYAARWQENGRNAAFAARLRGLVGIATHVAIPGRLLPWAQARVGIAAFSALSGGGVEDAPSDAVDGSNDVASDRGTARPK